MYTPIRSKKLFSILLAGGGLLAFNLAHAHIVVERTPSYRGYPGHDYYNRGYGYNHHGVYDNGGYGHRGYNYRGYGPRVIVTTPGRGVYPDSCSIIQQCYPNGTCVNTRVCD